MRLRSSSIFYFPTESRAPFLNLPGLLFGERRQRMYRLRAYQVSIDRVAQTNQVGHFQNNIHIHIRANNKCLRGLPPHTPLEMPIMPPRWRAHCCKETGGRNDIFRRYCTWNRKIWLAFCFDE